MKDRAQALSVEVLEAIYSGLRCRTGSLETALGTTVAAWHAETDKIPILWTEAALKAGLERTKYRKWLRWYDKEMRRGLCWLLLKERRFQRATLAEPVCCDDDLTGYSGRDGSGEETEEEGD